MFYAPARSYIRIRTYTRDCRARVVRPARSFYSLPSPALPPRFFFLLPSISLSRTPSAEDKRERERERSLEYARASVPPVRVRQNEPARRKKGGMIKGSWREGGREGGMREGEERQREREEMTNEGKGERRGGEGNLK